MFKWIFLTIALFAFSGFGQTSPSSSPTPQPTPDPEQERQRRDQEMRNSGRGFESMDRLRSGEVRSRRIPHSAIADIKQIYRNATSKEKDLLKPDGADLRKYAGFLKKKNTGIVRLSDIGKCTSSVYVVSAKADCLKYSMPGNGAYFSFRREGYTLDRLADIRFKEGVFEVAGVMQHGILTGLGDIDLDTVDPSTPGLSFLSDFVPSPDIRSAQEKGRELEAGIQNRGFYYGQRLKAVEGMTYALRSVAYRGTILRAMNGAIYDELDFDKRFDITVAFRIVRLHDDGSVTMIWKRISRQESPRLKQEDDDDTGAVNKHFVAVTEDKPAEK